MSQQQSGGHQLFGITDLVSLIATHLQLRVKPLEPIEEDMIRFHCRNLQRPAKLDDIVMLNPAVVQSPRLATFVSKILQCEAITQTLALFSRLTVSIAADNTISTGPYWHVFFRNGGGRVRYGNSDFGAINTWTSIISDLQHAITTELGDGFSFSIQPGQMNSTLGLWSKHFSDVDPFTIIHSKPQLIQIAKDRGLKGFTKLKKDDLEFLLFDDERTARRKRIERITQRLKEMVVRLGAREGFTFVHFAVDGQDIMPEIRLCQFTTPSLY